MPAHFKKALNGKYKYLFMFIFCLFGLAILYGATSVVVYGAGITEELQGTSKFEYARLASSYYSLDYYYDAGFFGKLSEFGYSLIYGLAKLVWLFVIVISYFVISIVREAYSLDIFSTFSEMITDFTQSVMGVTTAGVQKNGLLFAFVAIVIVILSFYMAYQGFVKKSTSKAFGAISNFFVMFIVTVAFVGFAPSILNNITSFSKQVNTMVLTAGTNTFTEGTVSADESPEYLSNSLWQVLVKNPWLILEFGDTDVEQSRVDAILANDKNTDARQEVVKNDEVGTRENTIMSADGVWDRVGNTFLILLVNLVICYFVLMLVATMLMYDFLFLLYVATSPFVFVFSMFPNNGSSFTRYCAKLFNVLMSKAVILFLMTLAFSLSTMVYQKFLDKSFLFVAFLQIVIYLSVYMNLHKLTALAGIHSRDGTNGISTIDRKVNRGLRRTAHTAGAFVAGNTVGRFSNAMRERKRNKGKEDNTDGEKDNSRGKNQQENQENKPSNSKKRNPNVSTEKSSTQGKAYDVLNDDSTFANNEKQRSPKDDKDKLKKENSSSKVKEDSENHKKQLERLQKRRQESANVKKRNPSVARRRSSSNIQQSTMRESNNVSMKQPIAEKSRNAKDNSQSRSIQRNTNKDNLQNRNSTTVSRQDKIHQKAVIYNAVPKGQYSQNNQKAR